MLVNPRAGIVPEHILKGQDLNTHGVQPEADRHRPVQFVEWKRGERHRARGQSRLPRRPARRLDRLIYRVIPDAVVLLQELRARRCRLHRAAAAHRGRAAQADAGLKVITADNTSYTLRLPPGLRAVRRRQRAARPVSRHRHPGHRPRGPAGLRRHRDRAVPAGQLGLRSVSQGPTRTIPNAGPGAPGRGRLEARRRTASSRRTASGCPSRSATTRPTRPSRTPSVIIQEFLKKIGVEATIEPARLADLREEAVRVRLTRASWWAGPTSTIPIPSRTRSGTRASGRPQLRATTRTPRADARARGGARQPRDQAERKEALRRVLEDPSWRTRRTSSSTTRSRSTSRRQSYDGFVPIPGVRRDLPVDEGREADRR